MDFLGPRAVAFGLVDGVEIFVSRRSGLRWRPCLLDGLDFFDRTDMSPICDKTQQAS